MVMVATIGLSQVLFLFTALPLHPAQEAVPGLPRARRLDLPHRHVPLPPGEVAHPDRGARRGPRPGRLHPLLAVGPGHAGHGRERRVGPAVGGVGAADLDGGLDPGRRAVGLHRHPGLAQPDERAHRGPQPRPAPAGPAGRADRGHGEPARRLHRPASASASSRTSCSGTSPTPRGVGHRRAHPLRPAAAGPAGAGRVAAEGGAHGASGRRGRTGTARLPPRRGRPAKTGGHHRRGRSSWSSPRCCPSCSTSAAPSSCPRSASTASSPCRSPCSPDGRARCRWASSASWPWGRTSPPTSAAASPSSCCSRWPGVVTGARVGAGGPHRPAHPRPLPGREHARLRPVHADARCWPPRAGRCRSSTGQICSGLPDPQSTLISPALAVRPRPVLGAGLRLVLPGVLVVSVLMVRVWRDRGIARRLISVRDNEVAAGAAGIPVVRTKLLAFALSGFMAGYAGVCLAFATERFSTDTFDPTVSILVVSMVVIGGLDADPRRPARRALPGRPARHLRVHADHPVPHQRRRAPGLHPLPARRHGPAPAPARRPRHRRGGEPPGPPARRAAAGADPVHPTAPVADRRRPRGRRPRSTRDRAPTPRRRDARRADPASSRDHRGAPVTDAMTTTRGHLARGREGARPPRHQRPGGVLRRPAGRGRGEPGRRARHHRRAHRAQRVGQDDPARRRVGPRDPRPRAGPPRRRGPGRLHPRGAGRGWAWSGRSRTAASTPS